MSESNPTEVNGNWIATGDDAVGWYYTQQTWDWKGRPLLTTHPDGAIKYASYAGCGCAGGAVATYTDEENRKQKVYADALGRAWKTEVLNWNGSVYSTTTNTLNALDQVTNVRQTDNATGAYQDTIMDYDGYGRLWKQHVPEQNAGTATVYAYRSDDTVESITDARGASATYLHLKKQIWGQAFDSSVRSKSGVRPSILRFFDSRERSKAGRWRSFGCTIRYSFSQNLSAQYRA